jgi:transposase-like protein
VKKHETSCNGKRRYRCLNQDCLYVTFSQSLDYPGRRREVKQQIVEMTLNGSGVRDISRVVQVSTATVIRELKKAPQLQTVNQRLLRQIQPEQIEVVIEQVEVGEETTVVESELDEM